MKGMHPLMKVIKGSVSSVLTPKLKEFENAISECSGCCIDEVAIFGTKIETFSNKNIACSIKEPQGQFQEVVNTAGEFCFYNNYG